MNQPVPNANQSTAEILNDQELLDVFRGVLEKWAFLSCSDMGPVVEGPAPLPLERAVRFSGPLNGSLVVRAPEAFGLYLWENASGGTEAAQAGVRTDAFNEFVNLFCGHLLTSLRRSVQGAFNPYLPQISSPEQWPPHQPQFSMALLVEDMPVEVRLWIIVPSPQPPIYRGL